MFGQMMDRQLLISSIARHAESQSPNREIVSVTADNPRHRYTYREAFARARKLANALRRLGAKHGDRIATLAWNDYRHFEIYYGVSCSGYVCHTINPRLFEDQISYIANHAEDRWLFLDPAFVPLIEKLQDRLTTIEAYIVLTDDAHMPATSLKNVRSYEALLAPESDVFEWPEFDERSASSLCYTSGTTGDPKGVLYHHRSTILHSYACAMPDAHGLSCRDVVLPVVPMFHVNAWGLPYSCPMIGCKLVFPGPKMGDPETLLSLIEEEGVTFSAGVPTVWQGVVTHLGKLGKKQVGKLKKVLVGGSAVPLALMQEFKQKYGVEVLHAWGMTEMSPMGTVCTLTPETSQLDDASKMQVLAKQGRQIFGVEIKIVNDEGEELPHDGKAFGALKVRGPWVVSGYYKRNDPEAFDDGWFGTGDVATIDEHGYMKITDRTKDVIKSGGEWISSIELENLACAHAAVAQAAVIGVQHPKWQERPLLVVVKRPDANVSRDELLSFFEGKVAKWWIPDDVVFLDKLPLTATGKLSKLTLRKQLKDYALPSAS